MPVLSPSALDQFIFYILTKTGLAAHEAKVISHHLMTANLCGHDSHGVSMLPSYLENLTNRHVFPNQKALLIGDEGAILRYDGQRGFGQPIAHQVVDHAIERCQENGVVLLTLCHATHLGRIGAYAEQIVQAGFGSLIFVNVPDQVPPVAPFGAKAGRFGTNPICFALPGGAQHAPIILDMATSQAAFGKLRVAAQNNTGIPSDWLADREGQPTTNARDFVTSFLNRDTQPLNGSMMPFGGYKGSGLALCCDILAGILSSGTTSKDQSAPAGITNHLFAILFDPARLTTPEHYQASIDSYLSYVKSAPVVKDGHHISIAGEPEQRTIAQRTKSGIPINPTLWHDVLAAAERVGCDRETLIRFSKT